LPPPDAGGRLRSGLPPLQEGASHDLRPLRHGSRRRHALADRRRSPRRRPRPRARWGRVSDGRQGRTHLENRLSEVVPLWRGESWDPVRINNWRTDENESHRQKRRTATSCYGTLHSNGVQAAPRRASPVTRMWRKSPYAKLLIVSTGDEVSHARAIATRHGGVVDR